MTRERLAEMEAFVRAYPHAPEDGNVSGEAATLRYLLAECVGEIGVYERTALACERNQAALLAQQEALRAKISDLAALVKAHRTPVGPV